MAQALAGQLGLSNAYPIVRPMMTVSLAETAIRVIVLFRHSQASLHGLGASLELPLRAVSVHPVHEPAGGLY